MKKHSKFDLGTHPPTVGRLKITTTLSPNG